MLSKNKISSESLRYGMIVVAVIGIILSVIAPGWGLAIIFAVLIVYLGWIIPQSATNVRGHTPTTSSDSEPIPKRSSEPEGYRSIEWKGMIFRSESENKIAKTLDHRGIFFIPPVRVRLNASKHSRQSRELDFVICHEGKWGVLEVDGPFHSREADAERDGWLRAHGISNIQRFPSQRCYQEPQRVIDEFLHHLENMP